MGDRPWDDLNKEFKSWREMLLKGLKFPKEWGVWLYRETTKEDFAKGDLVALEAINAEGALSIPQEFGIAFGPSELGGERPYDRIWIAHQLNLGEIHLAGSDEEWQDWEFYEQIVYVPSGAGMPTLEFDDDGHFVLGIQLSPAYAGEGNNWEIWLIEHPYTNDKIRKITNGRNPYIVKDYPEKFPPNPFWTTDFDTGERVLIDPVFEDLLLFYQSQDLKTIYYRRSSEDYEVEREVKQQEAEMYLRAVYKHLVPIGPEGAEHRDDSGHIAVFFYDGALRYIDSEQLVRLNQQQIEKKESCSPLKGELVGIEWLEVGIPELDFKDNIPGIKGELVGIEWFELPPIDYETKETVAGIKGELAGIEWVEIIEEEWTLEEKTSMKGELVSILWIEV